MNSKLSGSPQLNPFSKKDRCSKIESSLQAGTRRVMLTTSASKLSTVVISSPKQNCSCTSKTYNYTMTFCKNIYNYIELGYILGSIIHDHFFLFWLNMQALHFVIHLYSFSIKCIYCSVLIAILYCKPGRLAIPVQPMDSVSSMLCSTGNVKTHIHQILLKLLQCFS